MCLLAALLVLTAGPAGVYAETVTEEGPDGFDAADEPMIYNLTDSSKLPARTVEMSDVYGVIDTSEADEIESMFSEEAMAQFGQALDKIFEFEPVEDEEVAPVLGRVETFMSGGGVQAFRQNGNLLMGSQIGLTGNAEDKVKVLGTDANASAWIYIVDKDAMCFVIQDKEGNGIPNALVTISYIGDDNVRVTKSVIGTDNQTPGICVFDKVPDSFYGIVDIQADGYRAVSILDKFMQKGEHYTIQLERSQENELYVRGVDLSGKDLVNEETDFRLVGTDTGDLALKVIVTKTGNAKFPDQIEIRSDNRDKTVLTVSKTSAYSYDSNTRVYTAEKRWAEKSAGLLQDGDQVSVKVGSTELELEHLEVKNAVIDPGTNDTDMPVTTKSLKGNVSDRMGGSGFINITAQILQLPVTLGFFPDGTIIIMASYDITQLDKNTQYKYSSLFDKSWNPKTLSASEPALQTFQRSFWENEEKVKGGRAVLNSPDKVKCLTNKSYNFSMSFSLFFRVLYNEETNDHYGTGGIMFCGSFSAGVTEYFLFAAGPVVIPAYVGFEAGITVNAGLNLTVAVDDPPAGEENDPKWKYANNGDNDLTGKIDVVLGLSVFGGVGIKGVLGACATGYVNFDFATVLGKGKATLLTDDPHSFIDCLYGLRFDYYLLFFHGSINLDCLKGAVRLSDSHGEKDSLTAEALDQIEFTDILTEECADNFVPLLNDSGEPRDEKYINADSSDTLTASSAYTIDSSTYPDPQAQIAATKNFTALFRLAYTGGRTDIYYALQDRKTGRMLSGICKVRLPEGETRNISEFVVVPNKTDPNDPENCDKVYIGAILVDESLEDENERMRSTDVAVMVVDLQREYTTSSEIASNPAYKGKYVYSAPMPAGREDYCSVVYACTSLEYENGVQVDGLKGLLGAASTNTKYVLSYCENRNMADRRFMELGTNKVYSSGVIAPNEPSYWTVDKYRSSDKYLVVKGYGSNGYYAEDLRCNFRFDIEGLVDIDDIASGAVTYDSIITNWQYLNGCNYFIAGDGIYWMNKVTKRGSSDYEWAVEKVENSSGIISVDNRYALITNNDQSAVYMIGIAGDYEVDMEAGTSTKTDNRAQIYTLAVDNSSGTPKCTLHGPLTLKFGYGEPVYSFTASYNPDECEASGLSIIYTTSSSSYACRIRMWNQNAKKGLLVDSVRIPDYLIKQGEPYIEAYVTVRNYGYQKERDVKYVVTDESGTVLPQVVNGSDAWNVSYTGDELYTGDTRVDKVLIRPNPEWELNQSHELVIQVQPGYRYDGDIDDVVNSALLKADNTSLTAKNVLIGGKHYVSTSITNNTIIGEDTPIIKAEFKYSDPEKQRTMRFTLPTREQLYMYDASDEEIIDQTYHYDIDMDRIWKDGLEDGLLGIYFSLVDADGVQQSNEVVYVENPEEVRTSTIKGIKTDDDGEPLAGALIGLFRAGSEDPLQTAVSAEDGSFLFSGLGEGEYTVRELEAPEGYILNGTAFPVRTGPDGEVITVEITDRIIRADVMITLYDKDDPEDLLKGASLSVFRGNDKAGMMEETSRGVYEMSALPYGEYTVWMEKPPKGYVVGGPYTVTVSKDGETVILKAALAKSGGSEGRENPKTGVVGYQYDSVLFFSCTLAFILLAGRKKKKTD